MVQVRLRIFKFLYSDMHIVLLQSCSRLVRNSLIVGLANCILVLGRSNVVFVLVLLAVLISKGEVYSCYYRAL